MAYTVCRKVGDHHAEYQAGVRSAKLWGSPARRCGRATRLPYAVLDMEEYREYERMKAMNWLLGELDKGRVSGEQEGWLDAGEVFADLEARYHG